MYQPFEMNRIFCTPGKQYCAYLGSNISSTESLVNIRIGKEWTAIDRLSNIQKSNHSDKTKSECFQTVAMSVLLYGCTTKPLRGHFDEKDGWKLNKDSTYSFDQILEVETHKASAVRQLDSHLTKPSK